MNAGSTRVAAVQMVSGPDVAANLDQARRLIGSAAAKGARLIVLPENFALMGMHETDKVALREADGDGPIQRVLADAARGHGVWLAGGSVPLESAAPGKVRSACLLYDERGRLAARYDKMHLFGFRMGAERYAEARTIEPGSRVTVADSPFGRIGLSICYDVRFPELYRAMAGIDIVLVPSAFTATTGSAHWETLLRARAIENLAYVIAPAQGGVHANGRETHGDSMIVDPWGVVLERLARGPGVVVAEIDRRRLASLRASLPALEHRTIAVEHADAAAPSNGRQAPAIHRMKGI